MAAYVPPHKRSSKGSEHLSPSPALLVTQFKNKMNLGSSRRDHKKGWKIVYADGAVRRWFALGVDDDDDDGKFPSNVHLEPVLVESVPPGETPLALVNHPPHDSGVKFQQVQSSPWEYIADVVWPDLLSSYAIVRREMDSNNPERVRSNFVARFGQVHFYGVSSARLGTIRSSSLSERTLGELKRSFNTSVPTTYVKTIEELLVPKIEFDSEEVKDIYYVKISDNTRPDATLSCKCTVKKDDGKLQIYKIELNPVCQLVVDISCLNKDLDLRLMLCTKKIVAPQIFQNDEENGIRHLVNSAIVDPNT